MPELPEVETVKNTLKKQILKKQIKKVEVYWDKIIAIPNAEEFKKEIKGQKINDIERRGKFLIFVLDNYYLLSHLRMEGKYFIRKENDPLEKHQHIVITFEDKTDLRYSDTRKFGKMYLIKKEEIQSKGPLIKLGLEPWDKNLNKKYLREKLKDKPIKTELLDQSIIVGIGNIYADEILFLSKINPEEKAKKLTDKDLENIIENTKTTLEKAIEYGGTTVKTYTSSEGVHGRFQTHLLVHTKEICPVCHEKIIKIKVGGRGTYYCPKCQKTSE